MKYYTLFVICLLAFQSGVNATKGDYGWLLADMILLLLNVTILISVTFGLSNK